LLVQGSRQDPFHHPRRNRRPALTEPVFPQGATNGFSQLHTIPTGKIDTFQYPVQTLPRPGAPGKCKWG